MNAELPQTAVQMFKPMFVHCLITPEGSELLIHSPPTHRLSYKQEKRCSSSLNHNVWNTAAFWHIIIQLNSSCPLLWYGCFPDSLWQSFPHCEFQDKQHWNQCAQHEHHHSSELVKWYHKVLFGIYLLNNQRHLSELWGFYNHRCRVTHGHSLR